MDLSKAYDCLPHDLITAKYEAYGLSKNILKLLLDYLEGPKPRAKIASYSFWSDLKRGVPIYLRTFTFLLKTVKSVILLITTSFIVME